MTTGAAVTAHRASARRTGRGHTEMRSPHVSPWRRGSVLLMEPTIAGSTTAQNAHFGLPRRVEQQRAIGARHRKGVEPGVIVGDAPGGDRRDARPVERVEQRAVQRRLLRQHACGGLAP